MTKKQEKSNNIKKHEDKYLHIPKKVGIILILPFYPVIWVIWNLLVLICYSIMNFIAIILFGTIIMTFEIFNKDGESFNKENWDLMRPKWSINDNN